MPVPLPYLPGYSRIQGQSFPGGVPIYNPLVDPPWAWYDTTLSAKFQDVGGTTPATANDDPVGKYDDITARDLDVVAPADDTTRPTYKTGAMNGLASLLFTAAASTRLTAAAAADWNFLHDGTGCTVLVVVNQLTDAACVPLTTGGWAATNRGVLLFRNATSNAPELYISNGAAYVVDNLTAGSDTWTHNVPMVLGFAYRTGQATLWKNGLLLNSTAGSGSPSASDATAPLTMGSRDGGQAGGFFNGHIPAAMVWNRAYSGSQMVARFNYLKRRYGIT